MMNMNNSVVFKMHLIKTAPDNHDQYLNASRGDMITAVAIEDGTLGMYSSHQPDDITNNFAFEVFNDEKSYQAHRQAPTYQQFDQQLADIIVDHQVIDLAPQFMSHQDVALNISTPNDLWINIVSISVAADHLADFKKVVAAQLDNAIKSDPGILAIYAGTKEGQPTEWVIYEVFQSEETYRKHIASPDHQDYLARTKEWVQAKKVDQTIGDILVNRGND